MTEDDPIFREWLAATNFARAGVGMPLLSEIDGRRLLQQSYRDEPRVGDNHQLTRDQKLDSPRRGQAAELNRKR